jgi:MFS family permease
MTDPAIPEAPEAKTTRRPPLAPTVVALGLVSLLTDAASDMIWPLLPVFLVDVLHRSVAYVGLIEGVAEATAALGKYYAGKYSDRLPRKKSIVLLGYGLSSVTRPLLAFVGSPWQALVVRFGDRVGKGIRSAPRDALLASSTPPEHRGLAFGFHRAMDNFGAFVGPLVAIAVLHFRPRDLRFLFKLSAIPGALALLAIIVFVRESAIAPKPAPTTSAPARDADPGPAFRRYLWIVGLFTLANSSDFFLIARARDVGMRIEAIPALWAGLSLIRALATTPGGWIADRIGRVASLRIGWMLYAIAYVMFGLAHTPLVLGVAATIYGAYYGLTEGAERALVASYAPADSLGRAFGAFALVTGLVALPASAVFGVAYRVFGPVIAFGSAGVLAGVAAIALGYTDLTPGAGAPPPLPPSPR